MPRKKLEMLLPYSRQYGVLDELGEQLVKFVLSGRRRALRVERFKYSSNYQLVRRIRTADSELIFFRYQGYTPDQRSRDLAALHGLDFGASALWLADKPSELMFTTRTCGFRAPRGSVSADNASELPRFLTYEGWGEKDHATTADVHYVVTEEVLWSFTCALKNLRDRVTNLKPKYFLSVPEVKIHRMRADLFPFQSNSGEVR